MQTPFSLTGMSPLEFVEGFLRRLPPSEAVDRVQKKIAAQSPLRLNPEYRKRPVDELRQLKSVWREADRSRIAQRRVADTIRLRGGSLNDAYQSGKYFSLLAEIAPECAPPISDSENEVDEEIEVYRPLWLELERDWLFSARGGSIDASESIFDRDTWKFITTIDFHKAIAYGRQDSHQAAFYFLALQSAALFAARVQVKPDSDDKKIAALNEVSLERRLEELGLSPAEVKAGMGLVAVKARPRLFGPSHYLRAMHVEYDKRGWPWPSDRAISAAIGRSLEKFDPTEFSLI
jgi:hypothetical protein